MNKHKKIDLRSDTVTTPTDSMRDAMANASVGDDVYEEDPTIHELEYQSKNLFNKEAALFFPTGTMANQAAVMAHTNPGEEIILEENMHVYKYEVGGLSLLGGVQARPLPSKSGWISAEQVEAAIRPENIHFPETSLVCLENTHNLQGGTVLSKEQMDPVIAKAHEYDLPIHLDGARIFNAATALNIDVANLTDGLDSVMFCLSKGLAAPAGSMLLGSYEFIQKARKCRKILGGGMRQAGVLAAAGIVSLNEMTERLAEDHQNAQKLAERLDQYSAIDLDISLVQSNIVNFSVNEQYISSAEFYRYFHDRGIKFNMMGNKVRLVTHKDLSAADIDIFLEKISSLLK